MTDILQGIEFEKNINGIRHWAYWDPNSTPRFEVYRYLGKRKNMLVFQNAKAKFFFSCSQSDFDALLAKGHLKPFCIPGGKNAA